MSARSRSPNATYTAASTAATSASPMPSQDRASRWPPNPVSSSTPAMLTAIPHHTMRAGRTPENRASSADHTGWVEIMAVLSATLVSRKLGIQVAKCAARATPGPTAASGPAGRRNRREVTAIHPAVNAAASRQRYIAMASEGAAQAAIRGADALTHPTATTSSSASRPDRLRRGPPG